MRNWYLSIVALFLLLGACAQSKSDTLIVGMELAYPPFETKNQEGKPIGVSVDLAYALGEFLGKKVIIENTAWTGLIPALQTGKVDIVISSMTITEDRKQQVEFSDPYAQARIAMLVNINSPVNSIADLNQKGRVVAVKQGTSPFLFAQKNLTNALVNSFSSESAVLTEVLQGKADAFLYDQLTIYNNFQRNQETTKMVAIDQDVKDIEQWGMAIKKGNTELVTKVNEFLADYKAKNGFDTLTKKYLEVEKQEFDKYGLEFFF
ncbi:MAG: transporter substrate-binding domain-containing protein [Brevinema sp.]